MLCSGVFVIWLFPVKYSLVGCLGVALMCCLILYLVAIEVSQKRTLKRQLDNIVEKTSHKNIWAMNKDELYEHCRSCGLSEEDCQIAYLIIIKRLKGVDLYKAIGYSVAQTQRIRKRIIKKLTDDINVI